MFKRPRLSCHYKIVNAALAASLIFLTACEEKTPEETVKEIPLNLPTPVSPPSNSYKLQAVWATDALSAPVIDLAFAGGPEPIIVAVLETGQLQLFTVQADRITDPIDLDITAIAAGQAVVLNGAAVTLFPGLGESGDINLYVYAPALGEPIRIDALPDANALGLCAGPPLEEDALLQLGYWTQARPDILQHGHLTQDADGNPVWTPIGEHSTGGEPITSCIVDRDIKIATKRIGHAMATLSRYGETFTLALTDSNLLTATNSAGAIKRAEINEGITIRVPSPATSLAALSNVQFGNYPDGLIILGGPVNGRHQITLIEPGDLFQKGN